MDQDAKQSSACTPTVQVQDPYGPPPDKSDEIDVHCDSPSEPATNGSTHLPPERFASKKSLDGLDYIPAVFTPEEEDTLVSLFETLLPSWDTSKNRHLKHFGHTMGANGNNVQRTRDVPSAFEPFIERMINNLASRGISADVPNQLTVACYESGAGIGDHMDAELLQCNRARKNAVFQLPAC